MREIKTGGPAFPITSTEDTYGQEGMTLRDYFAAKAMQNLIFTWKEYECEASHIANFAYEFADAMIEERSL